MKRPGTWLIILSLLLGTLLRLAWPLDMEYKLDEQYMFERVVNAGVSEEWPTLGMPSGVHIRNPGMSLWIFIALGKLFGISTPVGLNHVVMGLHIRALLFVLGFAYRVVDEKERPLWLWGLVITALNPIAVMYHRKIWAQSVLPFFCMLFLLAWWHRHRRWGGFLWGLVGACLGQIHMSGFFFAFGFFLWAILFDRARPRWDSWILGSALGSIGLLPWIQYILNHRSSNPAVFGWEEAIQLRYYVFWLTDPLGLHLGNNVGVLRGPSTLDQLGDFLRYPLLWGSPTYLVGAAHLVLAVLGAYLLVCGSTWLWKNRGEWKALLIGRGSETLFAQNATLLGYGLIITLATVNVRRYYMIITFPFEFLFLARLAASSSLLGWLDGRKLLVSAVAAQALTASAFLLYIHQNDGAPLGDYGTVFRKQEAYQRFAPLLQPDSPTELLRQDSPESGGEP